MLRSRLKFNSSSKPWLYVSSAVRDWLVPKFKLMGALVQARAECARVYMCVCVCSLYACIGGLSGM